MFCINSYERFRYRFCTNDVRFLCLNRLLCQDDDDGQTFLLICCHHTVNMLFFYPKNCIINSIDSWHDLLLPVWFSSWHCPGPPNIEAIKPVKVKDQMLLRFRTSSWRHFRNVRQFRKQRSADCLQRSAGLKSESSGWGCKISRWSKRTSRRSCQQKKNVGVRWLQASVGGQKYRFQNEERCEAESQSVLFSYVSAMFNALRSDKLNILTVCR